ncbi:hypothetical protein [Leucobacter aridicollis]|uniref:hypothetical protein n=1 Tax=Leucobacter aridicollis TaxID=283878 RepID=UPI0021069932|nr:hypothetical protein [Leucobacter aridicollis]UTX53758.1 hypothetical protein KI794_03210 [Leucobacter aridicollis]
MQAVEFVMIGAARLPGVGTAVVKIMDFDGLPAFVTKRYDRIIDAWWHPNARVSREGVALRLECVTASRNMFGWVTLFYAV